VLWGACSILVVANVINIGADLGGMAEATQLITGIRSLIWIPVYAFFIIGLLFCASYKVIARVFKWLTLVLFAYVFASFYAHVDWRQALAVTFVPIWSGHADSSRYSWEFLGPRFLPTSFFGKQLKRSKRRKLRAELSLSARARPQGN
jgi:Mn2+/Fe2+ NRAMP family transporter